MSEAVSALSGAGFDGLVRIREAGVRGMITLRGDLADSKVQEAVADVASTAVPGQGEVCSAGAQALCWMSPDELLLLCPYDVVADTIAKLETALAGSHHMVANVSDARAVFAVSGVDAREVIAKLSPADLSPEAFQPGQMRRSRLAQVPAAFWMTDETSFEVICFRSVAQYVFDILKAAAAPHSAVGYFQI